MRHIIKTQVIDLVTDSQPDSFALQHRMSAVFYQYLLPVLERAFDELSPGDEVLQFGRLELELGFIDPEVFYKNEFSPQVMDQLYKQIKEKIQSAQLKQKSIPIRMGIVRQWLYYMQHGFLPWNSGTINDGWYARVLEGLASEFSSIQLLRSLISNNDTALTRIVRNHDVVFLSHLAEALSAQAWKDLPMMIESITQVIYSQIRTRGDSMQPVHFKRKLWKAILVQCINQPVVTPEEIVTGVVVSILNKSEVNLLISQCAFNKQLRLMEPLLQLRSKDIEDNPSPEKSVASRKTNDPVNRKINIPDEGVFVANAGMVLIHPFIEFLFGTLGLLDNGQFADELSRQKAMALLQYMVTGVESSGEYDWVVAKILCGVPLEDPVEPGIVFSSIERQEVDELLAEVIGRWAILKSTSVETLRETFLQRPGKLIMEKNDQLRLQVERQPLDLLLEHLPWSCSIIRFGWMPQVLKVDW
ncbi:MAG: contractile injection system tape measure protein [Chitinophagaceae bacterium]